MSTSAQNQSIENVSIPDVLNAGIPAIIQNIRAAQRRVSCDDLTARFFDNAVQSAEMLHAQLIDVYNAEADSHNSLVDAAENMQLDLGLKGKEIEELQLQIEHLKRQQQDAIDDATHDANQRADNAERISIELETKLNEMTAIIGRRRTVGWRCINDCSLITRLESALSQVTRRALDKIALMYCYFFN